MLRIAQMMGMKSRKYGGLEKFVICLSKESVRRGHQLFVVWEEEPASDQFVRDLQEAGAKSIILPSRGRFIRYLLELRAWLRHNQIDVVQAHFTPMSTLSLLAAYSVGVPARLGIVHSILTPRSLLSGLLIRLRCALAHRTLVVSKGVGAYYEGRRWSKCAPTVHYLGVSPTTPTRSRESMRAEFGIRDDDLVVACVAFHDPIKGVDLLLQAAKLIAASLPRFRILQIGSSADPTQTETLKKLAGDLGVSDIVVWAGYRDDVPNVLQAADVYCQPSRSEGLPLAILEAMNGGLPVVAFRVGGIPEAVEDGQTGLLVTPGATVELADRITSLLSDAGRRQRMGEAGRQRVRELFDLERQTRILMDMYESYFRDS